MCSDYGHKDNYIIINISSIIFTPIAKSRTNNDSIKMFMTTPYPFKRTVRYNKYYGQTENEIYIPKEFSGNLFLYVCIEHKEKEEKFNLKCFRLILEYEKGVITRGWFNANDNKPKNYNEEHINIRFPWEPWRNDLAAGWVNY